MANESAVQETEISATTDGENPSEATETLSWSYTVETSRLLRGLVALPMGVISGMTLAVAVGAAVFSAGLVLSGQYAVAAAILLALTFTAARLGPQLTALRTGGSSRSFLLAEVVRQHGWRGLFAASLFGVGVFWVGLRLGGVGFFVVVFGSIAVPVLVVSVLTSEGELDGGSDVLTYCGTDVELSALDDFRRAAVSKFVGYRLSYVSGAMSYRMPRFLVVPASVDQSIRAAIETGVETDSAEYDPPNRAVQATLVAFGLGLFAFAGLLLTVEPTSSNPRGGAVLVYAALTAGLFGFIFLSLAMRAG